MTEYFGKKIRQALVSWKSTIIGVGLILAAVGDFISGMFEPGSFEMTQLANGWERIAVGVALIVAKDNVATSEDVRKA